MGQLPSLWAPSLQGWGSGWEIRPDSEGMGSILNEPGAHLYPVSGVTLDPRIPGYRRNSAARRKPPESALGHSLNTGPLSGTTGQWAIVQRGRKPAGPGTLGHSREGSRRPRQEGTGPLRGDSQRRWERRGQTGTPASWGGQAPRSQVWFSQGARLSGEGREGQLTIRAVLTDA